MAFSYTIMPDFFLGQDRIAVEMRSDLLLAIEDGSKHEDVRMLTGYDAETDNLFVTLHCEACQRNKTLTWGAMSAQRGWKGHHECMLWLREELCRGCISFMDEPCFSMEGVAELSEWITLLLAAAEPYGLSREAIAVEARSKRLADRDRTIDVLRKLDFADEKGDDWLLRPIRLPEGHPMRLRVV